MPNNVSGIIIAIGLAASVSLLSGCVSDKTSANTGLRYWDWLSGYEGMTLEDSELMRQTARSGLDERAVGDTATWRNEDSGNRGVVELKRVWDGTYGECREVQHHVDNATTGKVLSLTSQYCRNAEGGWEGL